MRQWIHKRHPGQIGLLWAVALLLLFAFNAGKFDPAFGVEEVNVLAAHDGEPPPPIDTDSIGAILATRDAARAELAAEVSKDSLHLLEVLILEEADTTERDVAQRQSTVAAGGDTTGRDTSGGAATADASAEDDVDEAPARSVFIPELPAGSPSGHFALTDVVTDSTWPWVRTIPSRVTQAAVDGDAARLRTILDAQREAAEAWVRASAKRQRSRTLKTTALLLVAVAFAITWVWFGRPKTKSKAAVQAPETSTPTV